MDNNSARLNTLVDECLERCTRADSAHMELSVFLIEAKCHGMLTDDEVDNVEHTVRHILADRHRT